MQRTKSNKWRIDGEWLNAAKTADKQSNDTKRQLIGNRRKNFGQKVDIIDKV